MWFPCNVSSSFCLPGMLSSSSITAAFCSVSIKSRNYSRTRAKARGITRTPITTWKSSHSVRSTNDFTMTWRIDVLIQFKMYSLFFKCMQFEINITKLRIIGNSDSDIYTQVPQMQPHRYLARSAPKEISHQRTYIILNNLDCFSYQKRTTENNVNSLNHAKLF